MHSAEKARDATLNDENASQHVTSVVVTALCIQPEAFASDLGDDQSCCLFVWQLESWIKTIVNESYKRAQFCTVYTSTQSLVV